MDIRNIHLLIADVCERIFAEGALEEWAVIEREVFRSAGNGISGIRVIGIGISDGSET